MGQQTWRHF